MTVHNTIHTVATRQHYEGTRCVLYKCMYDSHILESLVLLSELLYEGVVLILPCSHKTVSVESDCLFPGRTPVHPLPGNPRGRRGGSDRTVAVVLLQLLCSRF